MSFSPDPHPLGRRNTGPVPGCLVVLLVFALALLFLWFATGDNPGSYRPGDGPVDSTAADQVDECWCFNPSIPGCATRPGGPCENCPRNDYSLGSCPGDLTVDQDRWPRRDGGRHVPAR